jgi:hypothetical protein
MALSKESADALRECLHIVASRYSPDERRTMARNVEQYIQEGMWLPAFTIEHVAALYYPGDAASEERFRSRIQEAIRSGELVPAAGEGKLFASDLAGWPNCPRVPHDSPLRYWLPAFMHEPARAELPLEHWLQFDLWALREVAYLLCGQAPRDERAFERDYRDEGGVVGIMYRLLKDAIAAGRLPCIPFGGVPYRNRVSPSDAVGWATERGMPLPEVLRPLIRASADESGPEPTEPAPQAAGMPAVRWTPELIAEARDYRDQLRAQGARDYTAQTAARYGISTARLREILRDDGSNEPVSPAFWPVPSSSRKRKG